MQKRTWAARLLLLVFLPILVFSSLHVHEYAVGQGDCYECTNHLHHSGHVSLQTASFHDCVLCQFVTLSYIIGVALVLVVAATIHAVSYSTLSVQCLSALYFSQTPRAPPVF